MLNVMGRRQIRAMKVLKISPPFLYHSQKRWSYAKIQRSSSMLKHGWLYPRLLKVGGFNDDVVESTNYCVAAVYQKPGILHVLPRH